jgi:hypothetical protein
MTQSDRNHRNTLDFEFGLRCTNQVEINERNTASLGYFCGLEDIGVAALQLSTGPSVSVGRDAVLLEEVEGADFVDPRDMIRVGVSE